MEWAEVSKLNSNLFICEDITHSILLQLFPLGCVTLQRHQGINYGWKKKNFHLSFLAKQHRSLKHTEKQKMRQKR